MDLKKVNLDQVDADVMKDPEKSGKLQVYEKSVENINGVEPTDVIVPGSKADPFRTYRISKQIVLCFCWTMIGFFNEIIGPTLQDLKDNLGVDYETVSSALATKSIGSLTGAIIGGFMHEKFYRHSELILAVALWLGAISTLLMPFTSHLEVLMVLFGFSGVAEGLINAGGNTIVMDLWLDKAAGPLHSLHFSFGIGAMLAPQIANPFLSPDAQEEDDSLTTAIPTTLGWNSTAEPLGESRIEICYSIIAIIVFVYGFVVLAVYLRGPPKGFHMRQPSGKFKDMVHPSVCGHGYTFFAVELLVILGFYYIHTIGGERAISKFLFSYAVDTEVQFTKKDASSLQTAFWGSFTAGRLLGIPIARFLPVWAFIMCDALGATIVAVFFSLYAYKNRVALWVTSCFMGLFIAVAFPNGMAWSNIYLDMNNVSVMVLIVGGACGGFMYQYLTGFLFDIDPRNLGYVLIGYGGAMILSFIIMQTLAIVHGRKILKGLRDKQTDSIAIVEVDNPNYIESTYF